MRQLLLLKFTCHFMLLDSQDKKRKIKKKRKYRVDRSQQDFLGACCIPCNVYFNSMASIGCLLYTPIFFHPAFIGHLLYTAIFTQPIFIVSLLYSLFFNQTAYNQPIFIGYLPCTLFFIWWLIIYTPISIQHLLGTYCVPCIFIQWPLFIIHTLIFIHPAFIGHLPYIHIYSVNVNCMSTV